MLSNHLKTLAIAIAALTAASVAQAAIVINPTAAPAAPTLITVTGSGARANGPVELFVNNVSVGSVQANASGVWSKQASIKSTDVLRAEPNQVFNFNTDGDLEGWADTGGVAAVTGGALVITESGGDSNTGIQLTGLGKLIDSSLPVIEIGYKTNSTTVSSGTTLSMANSSEGFPAFFGPSWKPIGGTADYVVDVIDMTRNSFGVNNPDYPTGPAYQIGFAFNGIADGQTFSVDFVRIRETFRYDFPYNGDAQWTNPLNNTPPGGVAQTVTGPTAGVLTLTSTGNGVGAIAPQAGRGPRKDGNVELNASIFGNFNIRATMAGTNSGAIVDSLFHNGSGFTNLSSGKIFSPIYDSAPHTYSVTLAGDANWQSGGAFLNEFVWLSVYFPLAAGDTMAIDYLEFAPTTFTGDAEPVAVTLGASVADWTVMN